MGKLIEFDLGDAAKRIRPRNSEGKKWYRIVNALEVPEEPADVYIYDEISWYGITAMDFIRDLMAIGKQEINLHINSPGGDVYDGIAIHNAIVNHPAEVHGKVDGIAASIASIILMACTDIEMSKYGSIMIHDASGFVQGNPADLREAADILDKTSDILAQVYADRTGGDQAEWRAFMTAETWFNSEEALEFGLVDEVNAGATKVSNSWSLDQFKFAGRESAPSPDRLMRSRAKLTPKPPEPVADDAPLVLSAEAFARALDYGANPPVDRAEAPFHFDPDVFAAMMEDHTKNAPAIAQNTRVDTPPPRDVDVLGVLRDTILGRGGDNGRRH